VGRREKACHAIRTAEAHEETAGAGPAAWPDAIVVAPATYNTINKWAQGISGTYALGLLAEITGLGIPIVVISFVNSALADRARSAKACGSCSDPADSSRIRLAQAAALTTPTISVASRAR
jgi:flavoprotein